MNGQGFGRLWIVALGLIGLFVLATVVVPGLTDQNQTGNNRDADDQTSGEGLRFYAPTTTLTSLVKTVGESVDFTVSASPVSATTGKGGDFAWVIVMDGADIRNGAAILTYDQQLVQWYSGEGTSAIGMGPRFAQGAGATSMNVTATFTLTMISSGSYTFRIWLADARDLPLTDLGNLTAVSPARWVSFEVDPASNPTIDLVQTLSSPAGSLGLTTWSPASVIDQAVTGGGWTGTVVDYLAISKAGIGSVDVQVRVPTSTGYYFLSWRDTGDRLVGELTRTSLSAAATTDGPRNWSVSFDLYFVTSGSYTVEAWAAELSSGSVLSQMNTANIVVSDGTMAGDATPDGELAGGDDDINAGNGVAEGIDGTPDAPAPIAEDAYLARVDGG
ncbi:MAG: hypothetical protein A4E29_00046 [Methanomassiliicoccales archaeon PtaB.Bin134]|nr:MAG: hypothetical protein A4E29_00046 [Methanomassiliicoccales archaeon PtaB.Bin134]